MTEIFNNIIAFEKEVNLLTIALRIALAVICGGIIGLERGRHGSQAGMRTHIFVCLGGAMTSLLGVYATQVLGYDTDPLRIAAQVVSGIGFLGAGMIIVKSDMMITGLTTAAIMWTTAIIGISVGLGFYSGAAIAIIACIFAAAFLTRIERKHKKETFIYIEISDTASTGRIHSDILELLSEDSHIEITPPKSGTSGNLGMLVVTTSLTDSDKLIDELTHIPGVHFAVSE